MIDVVVIVAAYGAILSSIVFFYQLKENIRRMKVNLSAGVTNALPQEEASILILSGVNLGKRSISLSAYALELSNKEGIYFVNRSPDIFPIILNDGESVSVWAPIKGVASFLHEKGYDGEIKLIGYFKDVSDKKYYSKKLKFPIDEWIDG